MMFHEQLHKQKYIEVYSMQQQFAFEFLKKREFYIPQLKNSHANKCPNHERAYKWMAEQFKKQMGWCPRNPFFWVWFNEKIAEQIRKDEDVCKVKLRIPVDEILISLHRGWQEVLDKQIWNGIGKNRVPLHEWTQEESEEKLESWDKIFVIPKDHQISDLECPLQGVIDRVEPEWILDVTILDQQHKHIRK